MYERITKKIIIDPYRGGADIGSTQNGIIEKNYNLELSQYIYNRLKSLNVPVFLTRNTDETLSISDRINKIKSMYGTNNDIILISNALTQNNNGAEIVYALRNSNNLSQKIANRLSNIGLNVNKYYQRRLPSDTSKDYYQLIRDTKNNESIILFLGNPSNEAEAIYLKNNIKKIGEAIVLALTEYLNIDYSLEGENNNYTVKKGDTLYQIANKFNTTVNELKSLNNLSNNNLTIGQILKIPTTNEDKSPNTKELIYTIKKGDNLYQIAKNYNTTIDEIKRLNNLNTNILTIGQSLKIPTNTEAIQNKYSTYKVTSGDSLYSIAKKYNTTVELLKTYNNLSSNLLNIGQILKLPNPNYLTYTVKSGDSLYSIAKKYNTTVNALKALNNLTSNLLSINQILKIPT